MVVKPFFILLFSVTASADSSFEKALAYIDKHATVMSLVDESNLARTQGLIDGSWGDPSFTAMAKNYPVKLSGGTSMMTGIDFSLMHRVPLTNKYGNIKKALFHKSNYFKNKALDQKQLLIKELWETLVQKRQINEEFKIFKENLIWITNILKVSNKLYVNGTISSQAILDIQIRKSEIETSIANKEFEILKIADRLKYLTGSENIKEETIPWDILDKEQIDKKGKPDYRGRAYLAQRKSKNLLLSAAKQEWLPDLKVAFVYTKRPDEDFVGVSAGMNLPFLAHRKVRKAFLAKSMIERKYNDYVNKRNLEIALAKKELSRIKKELDILSKKTIKFARDLREITSKSYSLGNSTYTELLQSELKLQQILLKKLMLEARSQFTKINIRYLGINLETHNG